MLLSYLCLRSSTPELYSKTRDLTLLGVGGLLGYSNWIEPHEDKKLIWQKYVPLG